MRPSPRLLPETTAGSLPRELRSFRDYHLGETILVCGCGSSMNQIAAPERFITIGVNDVGRLFDPDYLVVLNPRGQFMPGRFQYVERSRAKAVFTQLDLGINHPHIVRFQLGRRGQADFSDPGVLSYTRNSPWLAVCLAAHMGARRIGILGVDFTDHHFFAQTGKHVLAGEFQQIDQEYRDLYHRCSQRGIELFNLSRTSRLTALPKISPQEFLPSPPPPEGIKDRKVFFVNYSFLSCGNVFRDGLANAASELQLESETASWDDPQLPQRVKAFQPDMLFVVHGRKFSARWGAQFADHKSAIWLLDEPYEVDNTQAYSRLFSTVFVNDPATLDRHRNANYLPVCYDPVIHTYLAAEESGRVGSGYAVGFVGGCNPRREEALGRLARRKLLSYVVGGPWTDPSVRGVSLSANIPAEETARLYRRTRIVINVFRSRHHYNREGVAAFSLNPRVYEALACGALVISEHRPEIDLICPELPVFRSDEELAIEIERHLADPDLFARVRKACIRRLASHTYAQRLGTAISTVLGGEANAQRSSQPQHYIPNKLGEQKNPGELPEVLAGWEADSQCARVLSDGSAILRKEFARTPGSERGLTGTTSYRNLVLEFELRMEGEAEFIAKIHQAEARNQLSNSYHLMCRGTRAYLARHNHVFANFSLPAGSWTQIALSWHDGVLMIRHRGAEVARASDQMLGSGFCFLGLKGGSIELRNIRTRTPDSAAPAISPSWYRILVARREGIRPKVSILTTVYDRVDCLERCIQSVEALRFRDFEHIVVADSPPADVLARIQDLVARHSQNSRSLSFANLAKRHQDWGMAPAAAGLERARGEYVCFLSDDNGYLPRHFDNLVRALDRDPQLGFVYSSCLYDGRRILNGATPRPGGIDLGQPLFRRDLFDRYPGGKLPFHEFGWDWRMIEQFLKSGVRWRHVNDATFIFRLAKYPQHMAAPSPSSLISYCIACYRPKYARQLIDELIGKTTASYEILLWINVADPGFDEFVASRCASGAPIRVIGRTPENIGMAAYPRLFEASRGEMVAQIDDDVVCVSPRVAERAKEVFDRFPQVGMLTADVWQDEYTTGARPPMAHYRPFNIEHGLYDGPIDGWFAVYRKSSLVVCRNIKAARYFPLGCAIKSQLGSIGQCGLLCTRMKVFHVVDPAYVWYFGMLESEVAKYRELGRQDQVDFYTSAREKLPPAIDLSHRVERIRQTLALDPTSAR
jgi:spore maturation protein CgeB